MDLTHDYIKMCKKADEIQKNHIFQDGDYESDSSFWLPTQDQLQDLILTPTPVGPKDNYKYFYFIELLNKSVLYDSYYQQFYSIEQITLALLMKLKFHKLWDNNEWINGGYPNERT